MQPGQPKEGALEDGGAAAEGSQGAAAAQAAGAGEAAAAGAAAAPPSPPRGRPMPIFVSHEDAREPVPHKPKKSGGHSYMLKFYLVDTNSQRYLAVTGEDQGDAHYIYSNEPGFPGLHAQNKREVHTWLQQRMEESQKRGGYHMDIVDDEMPADPSQIHMPHFVAYNMDKEQLPDQRHIIHWYLVDSQGHKHLAVVGEEKETRDGHYAYRTQNIFEQAHPLQACNQKEVEKWLEHMVQHEGQAAMVLSGKAPGAAGGPTYSGQTFVSGGSGGGGGGSLHRSTTTGSALGRPPGKKAGAKHGGGHDLLRQATHNAKRHKAGGGRPCAFDPDYEARELVAGELRRWTAEEAARRDAARQQALAYATEPLTAEEEGVVGRHTALLKQAAAAPGFVPGPRGGGSHQQQVQLLAVLAALRELAHMAAPLSLVASPELKAALAALQKHKHPEVAGLAAGILRQWLCSAVAHAAVLTHPRYTQDPRAALDAMLEDRSQLDPIVAAVTHRKLQPAPLRLLPGFYHHHHHHHHQQQQGYDGGLAATPGAAPGLSSMPSAASLPLPADSLQHSLGGAPSATGERRRLDLDAETASPAPGLGGPAAGGSLAGQPSHAGAGAGGTAGAASGMRGMQFGSMGDARRAEELALQASVELLDVPLMDTEQAEMLFDPL